MRFTAATPLVLGSASPRRREMIAVLDVPFVVRPSSVDESMHPSETPNAYLERVVRAKLDALTTSDLAGAGGALVADTIVVAPDGGVLGKPADASEGLAMMKRLAGATHEVKTRFLLSEAGPRRDVAHAQTVTTRVTFRALSVDEAHEYAATNEGRDKAGGYAAQGRAAVFVERIDGSYSNVVGLPLCELFVSMRALGWV